MDQVLLGLAEAFTLYTIVAVAGGCALGMIVGAIPGMNAPMAIAIAVPLTFYMEPLAAVGMLVGVMKGGTFGGAAPAILLNTPGTPDAAATAMDGYPLARSGKPEKALKMSLYSSSFGDMFSDIVLILVSAPLAVVALMLGPVEILSVLILSLTVIAGLGGNSVPKAIIAAAAGLLVSTVGLDPSTGMPRLTFGQVELEGGVSLVAVGIGLLALGEVIRQMELARRGEGASPIPLSHDIPKADRRVSMRELLDVKRTLLRSATIGTIVGAMPGLGSTLAAFLGYSTAKRASKTPEKFGTGHLEGIASCEAANSAVQGANLIPLLALGIPGNVAAAMLVGAFIIHGVTPGPLIFQDHAQLVYGLFGAMLIANLINPFMGQLTLRLFVRIVKVPSHIIYPIVILLCLVGSYMAGDGMITVGVTVIFGILGYLMRKLDISFVTFVIGFVLGPMFESSMSQVMIITGGNFLLVMDHPIALAILVLSLIVLMRVLVGNPLRFLIKRVY